MTRSRSTHELYDIAALICVSYHIVNILHKFCLEYMKILTRSILAYITYRMLLSLSIMHNPGITIFYIYIYIAFFLFSSNSLLGNTWIKYWDTEENGAWKSLPAIGMGTGKVESDSAIDIDYRFFPIFPPFPIRFSIFGFCFDFLDFRMFVLSAPHRRWSHCCDLMFEKN